MTKHVEKVVGVEMVPEAVEDAKFNVKLNVPWSPSKRDQSYSKL
ncbi:3392_t:CDS:2 [Paraglomus occultum]|uniref:3392_t:CDS:1 n=1 Tax=Paraglomus occultum TaxID=144539 RepID=A0A9N8WI44_9GLOM|nr:3392_t:CDS:2 [Paraglomus occultum]